MDLRFNPKTDQLQPMDRVRIRRNQLFIETSKPFFLVRFIRWIRGDYNQLEIGAKINRIAREMLNKPEVASLEQWSIFKRNCDKLIPNYTLRFKIAQKYNELINPAPAPQPQPQPVNNPPRRQWYDYNPQPVKVEPVKVEDEFPAYDPHAFGGDVVPPEQNADNAPQVDAPQEPVQDAAPADEDKKVEIDAELKQRWYDAILKSDEDEDDLMPLDEGWEHHALNTEGPFVGVLSTPKGIIEWVCPSMKGKIDEDRTNEGKTSKTITTLLEAIGIQTPQACMQKNLEPTKESFDAYFEKNQRELIEALRFFRFFK
jgi:hypothetical protein